MKNRLLIILGFSTLLLACAKMNKDFHLSRALSGVNYMDSNKNDFKYNKSVYVLDCGVVRNKSKFLHTGHYSDIPMDIVRLFNNLNYHLPSSASSIYKSNPCLLIKNNNQYMLWEAGNPDSIFHDYGKKGKGKYKPGLKGVATRFLFRFYANEEGLISQLNKIGVQPEQISYIALSHLHYDHAGNLDLFPNAKVLIQKEELDSYNSEDAEKTYHLDLSVLSSLPAKVQIVEKDNLDIFGDKSVTLIKAPGHTPGHQILKLNLAIGVRYLSGDLYASISNFMKYTHPKKQKSPPVPLFNHNPEATIQSYKKLDNLLKKGDRRVWIQHAAETYTNNFDEIGSNLNFDTHYLEKVYMGTGYFYILK